MFSRCSQRAQTIDKAFSFYSSLSSFWQNEPNFLQLFQSEASRSLGTIACRTKKRTAALDSDFWQNELEFLQLFQSLGARRLRRHGAGTRI